MYMEVLHPCIWRFSLYESVQCIWRVCPCIWRFDAIYMEAIFYFRMEFPEYGMICPVQGCPASSFYWKFDQLKRHWYNIHVPYITMHQCSYCKKDFVERRHAKSHVKTHRIPAGLAISIRDFKKRNNRYRSPEPATLPRPRSTPIRSVVTSNLSSREQVAERRRRLAYICNQSQATQLRERGAGMVTRDQEVVQRAEGSTVRQPMKHWRGSGDDVVELDYIIDL